MKNILISECLLGVNCRYSGESKCVPEWEQLSTRFNLIPICPEQLGGLPTPRLPAERNGDSVINIEGTDVTEEFSRGAGEALKLARLFRAETAILKERSPSCGCGKIYDGTFTGRQIDGDGITAGLLKANGVRVIGESQIESFIAEE